MSNLENEKQRKSETAVWLETQTLLQEAINAAEVLQGNRIQGEMLLHQLQITPRSLVGTIALETGGIFFDYGWLRFLGSGCERMRGSLLSWNLVKGQPMLQNAFIVAYDVVGGFFVMNGGAFPGAKGDIFYMRPDSLKWQNFHGSYSQLFSWATTGNLEQFYQNMRWPDWKDDVIKLNGDQGFSLYPFLWANTEMAITERSRCVVPMIEMWYLQQDLAHQIQNLPPGTPIRLNFA